MHALGYNARSPDVAESSGSFPGEDIKVDAVLLLNGIDVTGSLSPDDGDLVGVVTGFALGDNLLQLKPSARARAVKAQLVARNHPSSGPIFSGPQQQHFVCTTARAGLGQPIVDNQEMVGIPVAQEDGNGNYPSDSRGYRLSARYPRAFCASPSMSTLSSRPPLTSATSMTRTMSA